MKTFRQFISEAKPPDPDALYTIQKNWKRKHPGMKFTVNTGNRGDIRLDYIEVPEKQRGKGIGTRAIKGLTQYADRQGKRITLTPAPKRGYKAKLHKMYLSHDFRPNKGRNRDYSVSDTMIRNPS